MTATNEPTEQAGALLEIDQRGVAFLTLNRPQVHNAFDDSLIALLLDKLQEVRSAGARVLVLGSRGKNFSAGADLGWMKRMAAYSQEENRQDARELARLMHELDTLPCPTICRVQGAAFGGAVGLAACCDLVVASEKARFCLSEVKIGLSPAVISPYVVRALGARAMRRYALTAEVITVQNAQQLGLVNEIVDEDALDGQVDYFVETLLANSPQAVKRTKELVAHVAERPADEATQDYTTRLIAEIRVSEEGQEGLSAFFEKRAPGWQE
ncbi:enoyl-CoA hydratase/isomerase family protein [Marinospirillum perlucidum]|uniref:enoyl-CoA hydratase/isomerase family protein n=1 Tax=Marinospirillum perlucidum TaxID=1982602 RepID=UPI000DF3C535|nr:enoyl-CoA hydratase/isomerase family protein [Marinospirillum perlucidum]